MIGTEAGADIYFASNAAWTSLSSAAKQSNLNAATLYLNSRVTWKGNITSGAQLDSWPRKYVVDNEGREIDSIVVPSAIEFASYELALIHSTTSLFETQQSSGRELIRDRVKAGEVEAEQEWAEGTATITLHGQTIWENVNALIFPYTEQDKGLLCRA